ncbi:MAG TPA: SDR family NAD(P)-dependent oxidoreductase [Solirubrobacteraceae bacterium]|jgi:NADP-dependent 3-hydroxy acid dehydrogenase YdfG
MPEYAGRIAVITGAASGIGLALAQRAAAEGMVVVLVDIDEGALAPAQAALEADGAVAHSYAVDVSDRDAMMELAHRVGEEVGDAWLVVNNAGVFLPGSFLELTPAHWRFIIDVNMWGVVYGMQAFLPGLLARDSGHIINTSSVDGIVTVPNATAYNGAKHAVTAMSETLYRELEIAGSNVGVSVLCPGAVPTNIVGSARHWPSRLGPAPAVNEDPYPELDGLISPAAVAEITFAALEQRRFWILTHPDQYADAIRARAEGAATGANPDDSSVDPNFRRDTGRTPGE